MMNKIYPRTGDTQTVYLNAVVKDPSIEIHGCSHLQRFCFRPLPV